MTMPVQPEAAGDFPQPSSLFRRQRRFEAWARQLIRLPRLGEAPGEHLLPEAAWQRLLGHTPDPENWLAALSRATGVYFFPSREWPARLLRWLQKIRVGRLLEAGAGRGYLSAALAPLAQSLGITFRAIDKGEGEFVAGLPPHPVVAVADVFTEVFCFQPEVVLYAWPPPGQSLAPLFASPGLRYILVAGEPGGGVTGAQQDWHSLPHKKSPFLSHFCRGRTGHKRHQVTIFGRAKSLED